MEFFFAVAACSIRSPARTYRFAVAAAAAAAAAACCCCTMLHAYGSNIVSNWQIVCECCRQASRNIYCCIYCSPAHVCALALQFKRYNDYARATHTCSSIRSVHRLRTLARVTRSVRATHTCSSIRAHSGGTGDAHLLVHSRFTSTTHNCSRWPSGTTTTTHTLCNFGHHAGRSKP